MWQTIRYRRLQATVIALLAALVTTCAVFAPLYDRATQQALTRLELVRADVATRGLSVTAGATQSPGRPQTPPPDLAQVVTSVPTSLRHRFAPPVEQESAEPVATTTSAGGSKLRGLLLYRAGACRHVRLTQGRCPAKSGELAVSSADVRVLGLSLGEPVTLTDPATLRDVTVPFTVVGVYRQVGSDYWFGQQLGSQTGQKADTSDPSLQHDAWLTGAATFADPDLPTLDNQTVRADFALDPTSLGVDGLLATGRAVRRLEQRFVSDQGFTESDFQLVTGLTDIASDVRHQRAQSGVTIPLLSVQLGVLVVVVLWLVLGAATEQSRPETAVALLRGRGRGGARGLLLRELLPAALVGVPVGVAIALGLGWVARTRLLPGSAPFELRWPMLTATAAAAAVLVVIVVLAVMTATRPSVEQLLRRVPQRRAGWSVGVLEALLLAAGGTLVVAFLTGGLSGPTALAAPAVLALVVGLLLAHATTPVTASLGRRLLRRGRVVAGVGLLDAARTPATRRTIAIVTVATSLLVFATAAVIVGARNRTLAAEQTAGARLVATAYGDDLPGVRDAVRSVDPTGRRLTTVVSVFPPSDTARETRAVEPAAFRRIALFPGRSTPPDLSPLTPHGGTPIELTGDTVSATLATDGLITQASTKKSAAAPVSLVLRLLAPDRDVPAEVDLGALPADPGSRPATAAVPCTDTCKLIAMVITTDPGAVVQGTVTVSDLAVTTAGGAPTAVPLGPASQWNALRDDTGRLIPASTTPATLAIDARTEGNATTSMTQAWLPVSLPILVTQGSGSTVLGLDGGDRRARAVGRLARVPGSIPNSALVSLDLAARGSAVGPSSQIAVWFAHDDPRLLRRLQRALADHDVRLSGTTTLSDVRRRLDDSTAAWSLALAVVVGVAALLLGVLVVVVMAATTWRSRSRDLAALRLAGLRRSSVRSLATRSQLPGLALAVVAGAVCGVVGAHLTLPTVPLFAHRPAVSTLDLRLPWIQIGTVAAVALVLLVVVGWAAGSAVARRSHLQRVRETL